jgi:hypothetical protein
MGRDSMKTYTSPQPNPARRRFLIAAKGIGVLSAIAVLVGKGAADEQATVADPVTAPPGGGYHETEHIRKYYRSMRF